jgi:hypothetical protein
MQVRGNGSHSGALYWFTDRADGVLASPKVISVPMFVYRLAMLAWALWLALSVVRWLRWGWSAFGAGGFWRRPPPRPPVPQTPYKQWPQPDPMQAVRSVEPEGPPAPPHISP